MMLFLMRDVRDDFSELRAAHGKCRKAFLPREVRIRIRVVEPFRGTAFYQLDSLSHGDGRRDLQKDMDVISGTSNGERSHLVFSGDASDIWMYRLQSKGSAVLRREDDVEKSIRVRV